MIFRPTYLPPPKSKAVLNPKTGKYETVIDTGVTEEDLRRAREECKDRIAGNEQFHVDPNAKPEPAKEEDQNDLYDNFLYGGCFVREIWNDALLRSLMGVAEDLRKQAIKVSGI